MKKYQFKTNINCSGCVARTKPVIEANDQIKNWVVDTQSSDKILTVESEQLNAAQIAEIVAQGGFKSQLLNEETV